LAISIASEYQAVSNISKNNQNSHGLVHDQKETAGFEVSKEAENLL